jgi:hypothetical protein
VNVSGRKEELAAVPVSTDSAKIASLLTLAKRFIFICNYSGVSFVSDKNKCIGILIISNC